MIGIADANSFYASCERVFNLNLVKKPVLVLSNNDGNVVALTIEAKKLGIKMGDPFFKVKSLVDCHQVFAYSSNYELYGIFSNRVFNVLSYFATEVERYSVDENFFSLSGFSHLNPVEYCNHIKGTVYQYTGIPLGFGLGSSKTLAKAALRVAKSEPQYGGVFAVTPENITAVLGQMAVKEVWGVGKQYARALQQEQGIETALELQQANPAWIKQRFGVTLLRTVLELQGSSCIPLDLCPSTRKSICVSRSFGRPVNQLAELQEAVSTYLARAAVKLRREQLTATVVMVFLTTNRYANTEQYSNSAVASLPVATNDTAELLHYARSITENIYRHGFVYHKAGVLLLELVPITLFQANFFDPQVDRDRRHRVMQAMDQINQQMGQGTLRLAAEGLNPAWRTRSAYRSPRYLSCWSELPIVRA